MRSALFRAGPWRMPVRLASFVRETVLRSIGREASAGLTAMDPGTSGSAFGVVGQGLQRHLPRRSGATRLDRADHYSEHRSLRVVGREGEIDLALQLLDADGDLYEHAPYGLERDAAPAGAFRRRLSQGMQQSEGTDVQEQSELVGLRPHRRASGLKDRRVASVEPADREHGRQPRGLITSAPAVLTGCFRWICRRGPVRRSAFQLPCILAGCFY